MKMFIICSACILLQLLTMASANWWLLGVEEVSQLPQDKEFNCNELNRSLSTTREANYCNENKTIVQLIAVGSRRGIIQCQEKFADKKWNCTTFQGDNLFGKFINQGTRETALVNSLLAAGAAYEISVACRDEKLKYCTCKIEGTNGFYEGNFKTYKCDHDPDSAKILLSNFFDDNQPMTESTTVERRAEIHNHNVGVDILKSKRFEHCRCTGTSGACTVQNCFFSSPNLDDIGVHLRGQYDSSVRVKLNQEKTDLVPVNSLVLFNDSKLAHVNLSPSFCETDVTKGVVGTENRTCSVDSGAGSNHCSVLCCDRGYYTVEVPVEEEECEFIWCCRFECKKKTVVTYYHYCNPATTK